jgi:signal transduction histidine kinase
MASAYGQACVKTLQTGEPFITRYFLAFSKRWLELTVSKMDDSHLIHHFTDVTSIREAELKLEKTLEELSHSNQNLEQFAYAASHDLREPVRKAQVFIGLLKNGLSQVLTDSQAQLFDRLENSQRRMQKLIEDLLEFSQLSKGGVPEQDRLELNEVLKPVLDDLELEIERTTATIHVTPLPSIFGNKRQMQQLFQNLVGNALKYSKKDVPARIEVTATQVKGADVQHHCPLADNDTAYHLIKVADNGIGFEQQHADKIFHLFTRLHAGNQYRGSGIGLSIVRKVLEAHNGYVWAESEPGRGSVFSILLPDNHA